MKKIQIGVLMGIIFIILLSASTISGEKINIDTYEITITSEDSGIEVSEIVKMHENDENHTYKNISFWVQEGAEDIKIYVNSNFVESKNMGNIYTCSIEELNITADSTLQITISYTLDKDTEKFQKNMLYNTSSLTITFDGNALYNGEKLKTGESFNILLYKPTEAPLSWYIVVIILLLVLLLIVSTIYIFKKQKAIKIKESASILRSPFSLGCQKKDTSYSSF